MLATGLTGALMALREDELWHRYLPADALAIIVKASFFLRVAIGALQVDLRQTAGAAVKRRASDTAHKMS